MNRAPFKLVPPGVVFALLVPFGSSPAHHSRAHFLLEETIQLEGTVTEVSWRSPHVYVEIDALNGAGVVQTWTLEGHSIPGFLRLGWQRDSVKVGDRAVVVAHPNRDPDKTFGMLYSVTLASGDTYYAYSIPEGETLPGVANLAPTAPSTDFSGTWRAVIPLREALIDSFRAPTEWPLTAVGSAQAEDFDINDDPVLSCVPMGVPRLILSTYSHRWTDDGYAMNVSYTIEDPVYLSEPVTVDGEYRKSSDFGFVAETCDHETARRHLEFF